MNWVAFSWFLSPWLGYFKHLSSSSESLRSARSVLLLRLPAVSLICVLSCCAGDTGCLAGGVSLCCLGTGFSPGCCGAGLCASFGCAKESQEVACRQAGLLAQLLWVLRAAGCVGPLGGASVSEAAQQAQTGHPQCLRAALYTACSSGARVPACLQTSIPLPVGIPG